MVPVSANLSSPRRALSALLVVLTITAAGVLPAPSAGAQSADTTTTTLDPATQRARNKQERRQVGGQIASLRASDQEVRDALAALDVQLAAANAALDAATAMVASAQAEVAATEAAERAARERAEEIAEEVKQMAIDEFVNPNSEGIAVVIASGSFSEARERRTLLGVRTDQRKGLLARQRAAIAELADKKREAKAAVAAAEKAVADQQGAVAQLESTRHAHVQFVAEVDQRLEAALGEAAALDALDAQLAAQISEQQQKLRAEALARQAAAFASAQRAAAAAPTTTVPRGGRPAPPRSPTTTTPPRIVPPSLYTIDDMDNVGGIYVNKLISAQFGRMLNAATAAGLVLGGGGFRDSEAQIATRRNNCGTSDFAIWEMPASQCSPPTARPGTSMHEQGMAVDFTCSGTLIRSHDNPCFVWLEANASSYGFINLPSEPWHWSINGN